MKLFKRLKDLLKDNREEIFITFDNEYMYYKRNDTIEEQLSWDSVLEIFVFKRDLFSVDLICIGFRIDNEGVYFEIDEEMKGYKELESFLITRFKDIKKEWFTDVAFPAFETNLVSLWGEPLIERIWEV